MILNQTQFEYGFKIQIKISVAATHCDTAGLLLTVLPVDFFTKTSIVDTVHDVSRN